MQQPANLRIVHFSDLHFTPNKPQINASHVFDPPATPNGDYPPRVGWPNAWEMLKKDLEAEADPDCPVIVCITGDLTHTAHTDEFKRAADFLHHIANMKIFGRARGREAIFVVPGNHDVAFSSSDAADRSQPFIDFYNGTFGSALDPRNPYSLVQLHDRVSDLGALVLCLHSAVHVERDSPDEARGQFDSKQLQVARNLLKGIETSKLRSAIRIALIHHHPVLIPPLAGKGYDAILYSGELLNLLRQYGFHVVLHGHKHYPHNFTYDATSPFHETVTTASDRIGRLAIVGGGSLGSRAIPDSGQKCNCYSWLTVRWSPTASNLELSIETRRLRNRDDRGTHLSPIDWTWDRLGVDERVYQAGVDGGAERVIPQTGGSGIYVVGPVLREGTTGIAWVDVVYRSLMDVGVPGMRIPVSEPELETAAPASFAQRVNSRIEESEAVIAVLPTGHISSAVETVMAAALSKPQLIVSQTPEQLPRLVAGLPNTWMSTDVDLAEKIQAFVGSLRSSPARMPT